MKPSRPNAAKPRQRQNHQIQIIGGEYRSRKIAVMDADGLRPTSSRVRETLFNWLQNIIPGSIAIDAFAGTGALGIEAISRGARKVIFIEKDPAVFRKLQENIQLLKIPREKYELLNMDSIRFFEENHPQLTAFIQEVQASECRAHLFLDPPFFADLYPELLSALQNHELLQSLTSLSIESPLKLSVDTASALAPLQAFREMKTKESVLQFYRQSL